MTFIAIVCELVFPTFGGNYHVYVTVLITFNLHTQFEVSSLSDSRQ